MNLLIKIVMLNLTCSFYNYLKTTSALGSEMLLLFVAASA